MNRQEYTVTGFLNLLEPSGLITSFVEHPPEDFQPAGVAVNGRRVPGFIMDYDPLTTADDQVQRAVERFRTLLPRFRTLFIGTTVSEYALFPHDMDPALFCKTVLSMQAEAGCSLCIIKDIPSESPLLTEEENEFSRRLVSCLEAKSFITLYGQALAYVPVVFSSIDEYLGKFSKSHRRDLKRKLRCFDKVTVEERRTGRDCSDESFGKLFYALYLNVYNDSDIHFDKLSPEFFESVLKDESNNGIVFIYHGEDGGIIGFNLCFRVGDHLVDKYIGFRYPDSRTVNLYFLSWFYNLGYCIKNNLTALVAGWTDPEIKKYLGADFTYTRHAVYAGNPVLRFILKRIRPFFEADRLTLESMKE